MRLIDSCFLNRTALEQEVGMACTYVSKEVLKSVEPAESNGEKAAESQNDGHELERPQSNGSVATRASSQYLGNYVSSKNYFQP